MVQTQADTLPPEVTNAERAQMANTTLVSLVDWMNGSPSFKTVRPARWRHLDTGHEVETGYSYGEGRVRVFLGGGRTADADYVISGREDDLAGFHELFPVSS